MASSPFLVCLTCSFISSDTPALYPMLKKFSVTNPEDEVLPTGRRFCGIVEQQLPEARRGESLR